MARKVKKQVKNAPKNTENTPVEIVQKDTQKSPERSWLEAYTNVKAEQDTAAKLCARMLVEQACTIQELMSACQAYSTFKGNGQAWGSRKSHITGHFRWLKMKGIEIQNQGDKYRITT